MTRVRRALLPVLLLLATSIGWSEEYKMADGGTMRGEPVSMNTDGIVLRLDVGGFSERISWTRFSQEALKKFTQDPAAKSLVEPFIELTDEEIAQEKKKTEIIIREVPQTVPRVVGKPSLGTAFTTPTGIAILAILFLANIFAAYEIAVYRNRPVALVCGLSAVLPVLGPIMFLSLPSQEFEASETQAMEHPEPAPNAAAAPNPGGLTVAAASGGGGAPGTAQQSYSRGDTTFNRRFFEGKFPGFFRVVPSDADKDLVMAIRTPRGEMVGRRITRISMNELHLQTQKGGGTAEVMVPFGEIIEVKIRHKDATS